MNDKRPDNPFYPNKKNIEETNNIFYPNKHIKNQDDSFYPEKTEETIENIINPPKKDKINNDPFYPKETGKQTIENIINPPKKDKINNDPFYPKEKPNPFDNIEKSNNQFDAEKESLLERTNNPFYQHEISSNDLAEEKTNEDDDLKLIEKINRKIAVYLKPSSIDISEDEKKKKIGITITTLIILVLIISCYYFLIYEPSQQDLAAAKTDKLNELHSLYKGPLASASQAFLLEKQISDAKSASQVELINIIGPATKDWKTFQQKAINENHDQFNRTMAVYETNENKTIIMTVDNALALVNENGVEVISNIKFEKPNTISVPILISRLQAGAGLISVGSVVDIYTQNTINGTETIENETTPNLSGCTVVSIMRCEESGEIESEYGTSQTVVNGNTTNPNENTKTFTANVIEMIKGSLAGGYNEQQTLNMLQDYGVKLSNCEREINLAEIDTQYLLLIEVPNDKVNYIINHMDNLILTIPTEHAPNWMVNEIIASYKK